jgi:DNA polymerase-4
MKIYKEISHVIYKIKDLIYESENLKCSIGISFSKSLAKYASKINKPDGITYINKNNYHKYLDNSPIDTLCGVSTGVKSFLNHHGVYKCSDMKKLPISILSNRFGNIGKKIWLMANGNDFEGLISDSNHPKSLGHGKVLKPNTKSSYLIKKVFLRMSNKLALRLRKSNYESNIFLIGIKIKAGWIQKKIKIEKATCNRSDIFNICLSYLNLFEKNTGIYQVQVTALNPLKKNAQMDIFSEDNDKSEVLDQALENIYDKFGPETIKPARLISDHTDSPDVIAPAWRPSGHRKSV